MNVNALHSTILGLALVAIMGGVATGCAAPGSDETGHDGTTATAEISREEAIAIARQNLEFAARSTEAVKDTEEGRPVWRVTFRGRPPGPEHAMGEFMEVTIDRRTGEVVSLAMS